MILTNTLCSPNKRLSIDANYSLASSLSFFNMLSNYGNALGFLLNIGLTLILILSVTFFKSKIPSIHKQHQYYQDLLFHRIAYYFSSKMNLSRRILEVFLHIWISLSPKKLYFERLRPSILNNNVSPKINNCKCNLLDFIHTLNHFQTGLLP